MNGIVDVRLSMAFKIFIENYGRGRCRLNWNQTLAHIFLQPGAVAPIKISLFEIFGVDTLSTDDEQMSINVPSQYNEVLVPQITSTNKIQKPLSPITTAASLKITSTNENIRK